MLVSKICLTDGPCGGKSSALYYIRSQLTKQVWDYKMLNKGKIVSPFKYCAKILDYMK